MKLLPFYTIDEIEPILGVSKQSLIQNTRYARISLAVMEHSLGMPLYINLLHEKHNTYHFKTYGNYRFLYIHQNVISLNENIIFTDGKIPLKSIVNFEKSPIGHPDNGTLKDAFRVDFGNEYYKKWWYETEAENECPVYLTCDAIQHSPLKELYMSLTEQELPEAQLQPIKLEAGGGKTKYELLVEVITSMGLSPLKLDLSIISKPDIFNECKKKYPKQFSMQYKSFGGKNGTFGRAIKNGHIKLCKLN